MPAGEPFFVKPPRNETTPAPLIDLKNSAHLIRSIGEYVPMEKSYRHPPERAYYACSLTAWTKSTANDAVGPAGGLGHFMFAPNLCRADSDDGL